MNTIGKIVLYFIAVLFLGALLAPPLFWAGNALIPALHEHPFQRFFNRAVLTVALALLWPLARSFRIRSGAELGLEPNARWLRDVLTGLAAAIGAMLVLCVVLKSLGYFKWLSPKDQHPGELVQVLFTAACVALMEESLFRGAFLGVFQRTMGKWIALFAMAVIFSVVHLPTLIKPVYITISSADVRWFSAFDLLIAIFSQFLQPMTLLGLTTLFAVGWILGYTKMQTRSLWLPIGLHAGWVICAQGFGKFAKLGKNHLPWIGSELRIGIAPLLTIIATGIACWMVVRRRSIE